MNRRLTTRSLRRSHTDIMNNKQQSNPLASDTLYNLIFNRSTLNDKLQSSPKKELIIFVIKYLLIRPTFLLSSWYLILWLISHLIDDDLIDFIKIESWYSVICLIILYCLILLLLVSKKSHLDCSAISNEELSNTFQCPETEIKLIKVSKFIETDFYHQRAVINSELINNVLIKLPFKIPNLDKYQHDLKKDTTKKISNQKPKRLHKTLYKF